MELFRKDPIKIAKMCMNELWHFETEPNLKMAVLSSRNPTIHEQTVLIAAISDGMSESQGQLSHYVYWII